MLNNAVGFLLQLDLISSVLLLQLDLNQCSSSLPTSKIKFFYRIENLFVSLAVDFVKGSAYFSFRMW